MVVAIDGPGGVGKSTVARRVASARGLGYLDTGATYRAAALAALQSGADLDLPAAVTTAVGAATIEYADGAVLLDGVDVSEEIRSAAVTAASSKVAAIPAVRAIVVAMQRSWVVDHGDGAVVEGRDIGTVVFPDALLKVFLIARPEVRAARRAGDHEAAGSAVTEIQAALEQRDHADSTRAMSPLRPADDALVVDTSDMTLEEVIAEVLEAVDLANDRPRLL
ncbi:MAG: (d)CMP kinase [bacterium]|nr:(d)CMP kinase [bacterium]